MKVESFISMQWFSERKPYAVHHHSEYDLFYLNLTRRIYKRIEKFQREYNISLLKYTKEEIRELAYLISGYAEDIFNNIGIFNSMREHFKSKFGSPLPIIKPISSEYSEQDIQFEDIQFLT